MARVRKTVSTGAGVRPGLGAAGSGGRRLLLAMALAAAVVAAVVAGLVWFGAHRAVVSVLQWLDDRGPVALLWFAGLMALVVIFMLPGLLFTAGAGFVFGVTLGSVAVIAGTAIGAVAAFLIARFALGRRARVWIRRRNRLALLDEELGARGWRLVLLTRLMPLFPFKLSNYLFGLSRISLRGFAGGTLVGIVPWSVHNVYIGALAADLSGLGLRHERGPLEWALYAGGFAAVVVGIIHVSRIARRGLSREAGG